MTSKATITGKQNRIFRTLLSTHQNSALLAEILSLDKVIDWLGVERIKTAARLGPPLQRKVLHFN
jgi:hypothetical protein